jgi:hypothetical protein
MVTSPTGIAFSPDGKQVAVAYETRGEISIVVFGPAEKPQQIAAHTFSKGTTEMTGVQEASVAAPGRPPVQLPPNVPAWVAAQMTAAQAGQPGAPGTGQSALSPVNNRLGWMSRNTWLYAGKYILDGNTDQVVARLDELGKCLQQRMLDNDSALMLVDLGGEGGKRLLQVQFNLPNTAK